MPHAKGRSPQRMLIFGRLRTLPMPFAVYSDQKRRSNTSKKGERGIFLRWNVHRRLRGRSTSTASIFGTPHTSHGMIQINEIFKLSQTCCGKFTAPTSWSLGGGRINVCDSSTCADNVWPRRMLMRDQFAIANVVFYCIHFLGIWTSCGRFSDGEVMSL